MPAAEVPLPELAAEEGPGTDDEPRVLLAEPGGALTAEDATEVPAAEAERAEEASADTAEDTADEGEDVRADAAPLLAPPRVPGTQVPSWQVLASLQSRSVSHVAAGVAQPTRNHPPRNATRVHG